MKTAIVYDWIDKWGGAERVLLELSRMFPHGDFFTSYYNPVEASWASHLRVKTSFLQQFPSLIRKNRTLSVPLYPFAFESLDLSEYDLVISVTSSYAKSVITRPVTLHICYMLSPTRFLWDQPESYSFSSLRELARPYSSYLKKWDYIAAQRPDKIIAISDFVKNNIKKYYNRDSIVLYPPFDTAYWNSILSLSARAGSLQHDDKYFLAVSRLEPYKKIDLVINVFNENQKKLIIIGKGSQLGKLKSMAARNIAFKESVSDSELAQHYKGAKALIMPQKEEFGYTALEAQFFGCPVISYSKGGVRETVLDGKTGIFFNEQTGKSLHDALEKFESIYYTLSRSATLEGPKQAEKFDTKKFEKQFMNYVESSK